MITINITTLLIYLLLTAYSCLFIGFTKLINNKIFKLIGIVLTALPGAFIAGIRENVGTDYSNYVAIFNGANLRSNLEPGFVVLMTLMKSIIDSPHFFFFVQALIMMIFIIIAILEYTEINTMIAMLVFMMIFYLSSLNIARQLVGLAICFFAFKYIFEKKLVKFLIYSFLAASFHLSSLIILPLYFIYNSNIIKTNFKGTLVIIILAVIAVFNLDIILEYLSVVIPALGSRISYFTKEPHISISLLGILKNTIYFIPTFFVFSNYETDKKYKFFMILFVCFIILDITGDVYVNDAVNRLALPLKMSLVYLIPRSTTLLSKNNHYTISLMNILYVLAIFYLDYFISGFGQVVPYTTIF